MKILVADDSATSRRLIETMLTSWGYEVILANDGNEAWEVLQRDEAPRLAILDWTMPGMEGVDICRLIREKNAEPYTYIIMLTAKSQIEDVVMGIESGADDYVIKPFDTEELKVRLRTGVRILNLQAELIESREVQRRLATCDQLTGIWNRRALLERMEAEIGRARRTGESLGIIMVDIDHFKTVNDTYGHLCGDAVLQEMAKRMRNALRDYDWLGRYGGEEFMAVCPNSNAEASVVLAHRLHAVAGTSPIRYDEQDIVVTISVGVTSGRVGLDSHIDRFIRAADDALYRAKAEGRNRIEFIAYFDTAN